MANELQSIIKIDDTEYSINAEKAKLANEASKVTNKLTISAIDGATSKTLEYDGSALIEIKKVQSAGAADTATNAEKLGGTVASDYAKKSDLFSKNYNDLTNKPTIPTNTNQTIKTGSVTFGANDVVEFAAGSNVTITGDATNKKITINSTGGSGTGDMLKSVYATNGSANKVDTAVNAEKLGGTAASDYALKSNLPTVNNATLTIQKNGTNVATFTANSSSNATANITVPTKTSELTNDSGFKKITVSTDEPSGGATGDIWFKY
jgi:hypothetical protein